MILLRGSIDPRGVPLAAAVLLTRIDGLALGFLVPGTVLDVATAHTILRTDIYNLLGATSSS